ncbi:MAG: hypothetical protein H7A01_04985 [Hahellaceae bacterium]|nr:hypothetical protein [Hahellaceae bacterium]MCP5212774.1 hypothetical protein [Hahellaceae bacterium]
MKRLNNVKRLISLAKGAPAAMLLGASALYAANALADAASLEPDSATLQHSHSHYHTHSEHRSSHQVEHGAAQTSKPFACELPIASSLCREYQVFDNSIEGTAAMLNEGCQSMGGTFHSGHCPKTAIIGRCDNILYNEHDHKSPIYSNFYYQSDAQIWQAANIQITCLNLGGVFEK